ncbi:18908_t:CDS:2, partial [Funneliformis geosporum]
DIHDKPVSKRSTQQEPKLIHSSQGCENLDACNVGVHFEEILDTHDPDDYEVVSQSQLIISRQAFRNNASKYFINGQQSNYTEVTTGVKPTWLLIANKHSKMMTRLQHIAGLNPKAFRYFTPQFETQKLAINSAKWILDGDLLFQFQNLAMHHQKEMTKHIGTMVERIIDDLLVV